MTLRLNGSTSGYVEIDAPATAGSNTLVLPTGNGTAGQFLQTNGSGALSWATVSVTTASWTKVNTSASSSSGTIEFTGLPGNDIDQLIFSWNNLNSTGNYGYIIDIGPSGGYATSGYRTNSGYIAQGSSSGVSRYTTAFNLRGSAGGGNNEGQFILTNHSGNIWQITGTALDDGSDIMYFVQGSCALSGTLDRIRVRTESGNFDAQGSATVQYLRTP